MGDTKKIIESRDIVWLNKLFATYFNKKGVKNVTPVEEEDSEDELVVTKLVSEINLEETPVEVEEIPKETSTDDAPPSMRKRRRTESEEEVEFGFLGAVASDPKEPKTFNQAWNCTTEERDDWREAIRKELMSMKTREVWNVVSLDKVPEGRKIIGCKWVFKKKRNGVQRARLVALGYSQVPGIDFSENFAPVIDDATFRLVLTLIQRENLEAYSLDVETAFLHGKLEEEIYMKKPKGYKEVFGDQSDLCLRLKKSIYGLVQAARQWWKKFKSEMDKIGFVNSQVDPCLFLKVKDEMKCVLTLYVDDSIIAGDKELIEDTISDLKKVFNIKVQGNLEDYLGCEITRSEKGFCIGQKRIIEDLVQRLKSYLSGREFKTPSPGGYGVTRPSKDSKDCLKNEEQVLYRSAVGSLLYLVKHSRPDLANSIREFSKVMDCAEQSHWKELLRMVKYVSLSRNKELCLFPDKNDTWMLEVFSNSDYSGDKDTRRSVSGYVIYCNGSPIAWRSKGQKLVTLSSTEAEYVAISEAVREVRFVYQVMRSLKIEVKLPIRVNVDNLGAIFLAKNKNASERTKHVDDRHHYVRELIEENFWK
jgi:Reverse transcriptase (RNA-dependent DNA polymerase)